MLPGNEVSNAADDKDFSEIVDIEAMAKRREEMLEKANIDEHGVLDKAKKDVNGWSAYFSENISRGKADVDFLIRDQWEKQERNTFALYGKPALTFNKLYDSVKKIGGEQRKNKPDLIVRSLNGRASQEEIDLRADLVRTIAYQSQNELVYQGAFMSALERGYGAFQIGIEYENPNSFHEVIRYWLIQDPTMASFDPQAIQPHKGDGNFCARNYVMSREEFKATYPYIPYPVSYTDPVPKQSIQWTANDESIVLCDYFVKEWTPIVLYKLSNGRAVTKEQWETMQKRLKMIKEMGQNAVVVGGMILNDIPVIVGERQSQTHKIIHYRLIHNQIVDFNEWPSKYLPIIFCDGDSHWIDGQQYTKSFIHDAKDAQRFINYVGSEIAGEIKNRRREQWLATPDNLTGYDFMWRNPELQAGALVAKPDPKTGQMPQKQPPWDLSPAMLQEYQRGTMDIKEILGFHEELQGAESNAQSGVAIANRQRAGSMSAFVFFDNLNQAIEQGGRVVLDLLPIVYGGEEERGIIVSKSDGSSHPMMINQRNSDGSMSNVLEKGDYDIEIDTGPSFAVQKEAALQLFLGLVQTNPQLFPLVADLIAKNLDVQFRPQIEERFKSLVPPEILAKEQGLPPPPPQPNPQEEMLALQKEMLQMQQEIALKKLAEQEEELKIKKEQHEIDKAKLLFQMQELKMKSENMQFENTSENKKVALNYDVQMKKILADLHKNNSKRDTGVPG